MDEGNYENLAVAIGACSSRPFSWRSFRSWSLLAVAVLGFLATVVLLVAIGARLLATQSTIVPLCFVSLCITIISTSLFLITTWRHHLHRQAQQTILFLACLLLLALSLGLTLATAIQTQVTVSKQDPTFNHTAHDAGLIVVAVFSALAQLGCLVMNRLDQPRSAQPELHANESQPEMMVSSRPATSRTQSTVQSNPFTDLSGAPSLPSSISAISIQTTLSKANSKTRSRSASILSDASQLDFHWDTSSVPATLRDTVHRNIPTTLPTIPGSRPVSPARALDGPFLPPSPHPNQSQLNSPLEAHTPIDQLQSDPIDLLPPQFPFAQKSSASNKSNSSPPATPTRLSRCPSAVSLVESVSHLTSSPAQEPVEAHIHPLFRSNSPNPAPQASRKTIVTAASINDAEELVTSRVRAFSQSGPIKSPTSPLASGGEWNMRILDAKPTILSLPLDFESHDPHASDVIILPSLPRSSTSNRPRVSTSFTTGRPAISSISIQTHILPETKQVHDAAVTALKSP